MNTRSVFLFFVLFGQYFFYSNNLCAQEENTNSTKLDKIKYFNITDIGILAGKREGNEKYSFSFNTINGAQIGDHLTSAIGFGIEFMDINVSPLFCDVRWNFNKGKLQVFTGLQGGVLFPLESKDDQQIWNPFHYKKGYFYNPIIGFRANFNQSKNAFLITLGFRHMKIVGERQDNWWEDTKYERIFKYDRFSFRVGYLFN